MPLRQLSRNVENMVLTIDSNFHMPKNPQYVVLCISVAGAAF